MRPRRAVVAALLAVAGMIAPATPASAAGTTPTKASPPATSARADCTFEYLVTTRSDGNFAATLVVTNTGPDSANNWWIEFDLPNGVMIAMGWDGTFQQFIGPSNSHVRVDAPVWNPILHPDQYAEPGFIGTYSVTTGVTLSNIRLNDVPCTRPPV